MNKRAVKMAKKQARFARIAQKEARKAMGDVETAFMDSVRASDWKARLVFGLRVIFNVWPKSNAEAQGAEQVDQ